MAYRTVLNLIGSSQWRPVAREMLHILNMNRVQDAVVCDSVNELLKMCRNYEQQVIICPATQFGPGMDIGFINRYTPYKGWTVYVPEVYKYKPHPDTVKQLDKHVVWPHNGTLKEKTEWLDRLVRFSKL
jgi:hypothetical protein